jgi:hypothetical protein
MFGLVCHLDFHNDVCKYDSKQSVPDRPVMHQKKVTFDDKAKVGVLIQKVHTFKKQKLAKEAEEESQKEQQALACAVNTHQYAVVQCTGSVTGRAKVT